MRHPLTHAKPASVLSSAHKSVLSSSFPLFIFTNFLIFHVSCFGLCPFVNPFCQIGQLSGNRVWILQLVCLSVCLSVCLPVCLSVCLVIHSTLTSF
uniref:Uncharacterized protein n=1 Tax=Takifugu rubripes TaxID=31033 RepID=A0A674PEI1_TAKRU